MSKKTKQMNHLLTAEGEKLLKAIAENPSHIPWNEYPRPQLQRDSFLCLNGIWEFSASGSFDTAATESIQRETGDDGFSLENILTDTESEETMVERIALRQAIEKLPEREALVIKLRYFHGLTQQRVSTVLAVSQVQVSRIEKKALGNLKALLV